MTSSTSRTAVLTAVARFFDELDEAIIVVDATGTIEHVNGAFSRGAGYSADRITHTPLEAVVAVDQVLLLRAFLGWHFAPISTLSSTDSSTDSTMAPDRTSRSFRITLDVASDGAWARMASGRPAVSAVEVAMRWTTLPDPDLAAVVVQPVHTVEQGIGSILERIQPGRPVAAGASGYSSTFERRAPTGRSSRPPLSLREREILQLVLNGNRVSTVAAGLYLSENTVRNHLKRIYRKIGVNSLGELRESIRSSERAS